MTIIWDNDVRFCRGEFSDVDCQLDVLYHIDLEDSYLLTGTSEANDTASKHKRIFLSMSRRCCQKFDKMHK